MATIALPRPLLAHRSSSPLPSLASNLNIENINTSVPCPIPIPNKHLPICPPGSASTEKIDPSASLLKQAEINSSSSSTSLLYPPDKFRSIKSRESVIYMIDARGVAMALEHLARQPLPEPSQVFPWLHGLHPQNHVQQAFFTARRRTLRKTPKCMRGITIVKAGGDLSYSKLKGAIAPEELLNCGNTGEFRDIDPRDGFSVRNFHIQTVKCAVLSDIIVYGENDAQVRKLAWNLTAAQQAWRRTHESHDLTRFNTFACTSPFGEFESNYPEVVAVDSGGQMTGNVMDFFRQERLEMSAMTKSSEIAHNVWLGPTPDSSIDPASFGSGEDGFDIFIECCDLGRLNPKALEAVAEMPDEQIDQQMYFEFPSSGSIVPPTWSLTEIDGIRETCKWIYSLATGTWPQADLSQSADSEGDIPMLAPQHSIKRPRRILLHCTDGYTETSMLALAYYIYCTGVTVSEAWIQLHRVMSRNFFAYPSDVTLLGAIRSSLVSDPPKQLKEDLVKTEDLAKEEPRWLAGMDGSLPSRILDYMYLGNLGHANNPDLLRALGITQILSVGELATWADGEKRKWGKENVCVVKGVQDNGVDPLTDEFERCLSFIDRGRRNGSATLVHCRVGVSRSATICIAEVMQALNLSYPRAYCFVRARRLNVIIQPHLRFSYELLKWEEMLQQRRGENIKRELEWGEIAREIAAMNKPYSR